MKKYIALLLALVMVLTMAACTKTPAPTQPSTEPSAAPSTEPGTEPSTEPTEDNSIPASEIGSYEGEIIVKAEQLALVKNDGDFGVAQGACTDGKYIYFILENQKVEAEGGYKANPHYSKILKIDPTTMETVQVSEPLLIDHGNDVTYNSKTHMLVVSHNTPNRTYLSYVNPDTLELVETVKDHELQMYSIAYNATLDKYVVGISHGYDFAILDSNLKVEKTFKGENTGWTKQGMECDDNYIYFLQYNKDAIVIYDWEGNYVKTLRMILIKFGTPEPEALMLLNGEFIMTNYIGAKSGGSIFKLSFVKG